MNSKTKSASLLSVASTIALMIGIGASPASASGNNGYHPSQPPVPSTPDCCSLNWRFDASPVTIATDPITFDMGALGEICATQTFTGFQLAAALASDVGGGGVSNSASAIANVVSVNGGQNDQGDTVRSAFPAVVQAVQNASGKLIAVAGVYGADVTGHGDFANAATAAVNIADIQSTSAGVLKDKQTAGSISHDFDLRSAAFAVDVGVNHGDFGNSASSVANVASVDVGWEGSDHTVLALADLTQNAYVDISSFAKVKKADVNGKAANTASSIANAVNVSVEAKPGGAGYAMLDLTQATTGTLSSVALASHVTASGGFTNAATSAANVISVINK